MPASPDPDLALRLAKATADIYGNSSAELLRVVASRLARGIDEPGWAERKLIEVIELRTDAQGVIDRLASEGGPAIREAIRQAATHGAGDAVADGIVARGQLGAATHVRAVEALVLETITQAQSTHTQILRSTVDAYRAVIAETTGQVVAGTQTRRQATQAALDRWANGGVHGFVDRAGRNWEIESYAEMATRTAVGRAQVAGTLDRFTANGRDLVIVSDHSQECEVCRPWESRVLSISGATPRGTRLSDGAVVAGTVREATSDGLFHANCRHALTAYTPGLTRPAKGQPDPQGDAARQEQRRLERGVRQWKRRAAVAMGSQARRRADAKVREWQGALRRHVDQNDLKRQRYREQLHGGPGPAPPSLLATVRELGDSNRSVQSALSSAARVPVTSYGLSHGDPGVIAAGAQVLDSQRGETSGARRRQVPLEGLLTSQPAVNPHHIAKLAAEPEAVLAEGGYGPDDLVAVARVGDQYVIVDGHHRAIGEAARTGGSFEAWVWEG